MESTENWEMVQGIINPALQNGVISCTGFYERSSTPVRRLEGPSMSVKVIICFDGGVEITPAGHRSGTDFTAFVAGFRSGTAVSRHDGRLGCMEIEFHPAAHQLLTPAFAGAGLVDLADLWDDASVLVERLQTAPDWDARFAIVNDALLARKSAESGSASAEIAWAWKQIVSSQGQIDIGALAREIGWSGRHLAARFRDVVGEPPKAVARRARFDRARALITSQLDYNLSEIALICGYSDQSHLTRDFGEFVGVPPARYRAAVLGEVLGVSADDLGI